MLFVIKEIIRNTILGQRDSEAMLHLARGTGDTVLGHGH